MLRRLFVGWVLGLLVGGVVAAGLVAGFGLPTFSGSGGAILGYLAASISGVLTGLVAGKPIWASGAKIEAGLKAISGALLGAGAMFAIRRWGGSLGMLEVPAIGANGATAIGDLPAVSLPLVAAILGAFFELDNTGGDEEDHKKDAGAQRPKRLSADGMETAEAGLAKTPREVAEAKSDDEAEQGSRRAKG